jgi:hypothetical protein
MYQIAIAVRDVELFVMATVVRSSKTDVYVNWPRDGEPEWKPHTSYHASGQHHHKSHGVKFGIRTAEKPDANFTGTRNIVSFPIAAGEHKAVNVSCKPNDFDVIFEVPFALVGATKYTTYVYVDLVQPGVDPVLFPGAAIKAQEVYRDAEPWIVVSLLEILPNPNVQEVV